MKAKEANTKQKWLVVSNFLYIHNIFERGGGNMVFRSVYRPWFDVCPSLEKFHFHCIS